MPAAERGGRVIRVTVKQALTLRVACFGQKTWNIY
jgi:hypothetical protein